MTITVIFIVFDDDGGLLRGLSIAFAVTFFSIFGRDVLVGFFVVVDVFIKKKEDKGDRSCHYSWHYHGHEHFQ